jgi:hypothetical protein
MMVTAVPPVAAPDGGEADAMVGGDTFVKLNGAEVAESGLRTVTVTVPFVPEGLTACMDVELDTALDVA